MLNIERQIENDRLRQYLDEEDDEYLDDDGDGYEPDYDPDDNLMCKW